MSHATRRWLVLLTFVAFALRMPAFFTNTFFPDEALYASWARLIATGRDLFLAGQPLDKPPFLFYWQALFLALMGSSTDWAVRLPNLFASVMVIPLVGQLVWRVYKNNATTIVGVGIMALSPFAIQFSATAFTDPLMVMLLVGALVVAVEKSKTENKKSKINAGILLTLAFATKQTALIFLPLLLAIGIFNHWQPRQWRQFSFGIALILIPLLIWDFGRPIPNTWATTGANYGSIRPAYSWELLPRLQAWATLWQLTIGSKWLILATLLLAIYNRHPQLSTINYQLSILFLLTYALLHWLAVIPVWDRYLLPTIPLIALLIAPKLSTINYQLSTLFLLLLMLPFSLQARNGVFSIGGQATADQGIAQIAQVLEPYPYGTVLYDQTSSWHWKYYLIDQKIFHSWYPNPDFLLHDLQTFANDTDQRFLILPNDDSATPTHRTLTSAGFELQYVTASDKLVLYQINILSPNPASR